MSVIELLLELQAQCNQRKVEMKNFEVVSKALIVFYAFFLL